MKQSSFDDIIKSKVGRYEAPVPADAWENIVREKKKRRRFLFFWWIPGVLLAGTVFVMRYHHTANPNAVGSRAAHSIINNRTDTANKTINNAKPEQELKTNTATAGPRTIILAYPGSSSTGTTKKMYKKQATSNSSGHNDAVSNRMENNSPVISVSGAREDNAILPAASMLMNGQLPVHFNIQNPKPRLQDSIFCFPLPDSGTLAQLIKKPTVKRGWTIDISITPFIPIQKNASLLYLKRTETTGTYQTTFTADKIHTSVAPSLALSVAARKKINRKLEIGAGIQYARTSEKVQLSGTETKTSWTLVKRLKTDNTGPHLVDDTFKTVTSGARVIDASNSYTTLSIPLFIQYKIVERRLFSLSFDGGAFVNVVRKYSNSINGDFQFVYASGKQPGRGATGMNLDIFAGLRVSTAPRKRWRLFAEPVFRYGLQENNSAGMINAKYLHQAGLSIGGSYTID